MNATRPTTPEAAEPESKGTRMPCDEIQALLFDYMSHELGGGRAELVREHLRKCEACQAATAEIQQTLDVLKQARHADDSAPYRLTEDRHRRIHWAILHPILDWIYRHHILVALAVAALCTALIVFVLTTRELWMHVPDSAVPVNVTPMPGPGPQ